MVRQIDMRRILPHPENSNHMNEETLSKLRTHIKNTGRYEPLIVRPHPVEKNKFQIINGHNRLIVLRSLGYGKVKCVVWKVNDIQTRLYLATLNRLSGNDIPERRALLIGSLFERYQRDDLVTLLPESHAQLAELERLEEADLKTCLFQNPSAVKGKTKSILEFFLDSEEAKDVNLALETAAKKHREAGGRSQALAYIARSYLRRGLRVNR